MKNKNILVVGGVGYIGSHQVKMLADNDYNVVVYDNLSTGYKDLITVDDFVKGDLKDKDKLRKTISPDAGFTEEERNRHIKRTAHVAQMLAKHGVIVIVSLISPYQQTRNMAKEIIENFNCIHVHCPIEICKKRDPKGLYKQALNGEIDNFTGIDDPYEEPKSPQIKLNTDQEKVDESVFKIIEWLKRSELIS